MAGFKVKLNDDTYIGFKCNTLTRTTFEDAHVYSTVAITIDILKFMVKHKDISVKDMPVIVNIRNEVIKENFL